MKRDIDLARAILFAVEAHDSASSSRITIDGWSEEQIDYHVHLLADAGLIQLTQAQVGHIALRQSISLTWQGHDFLDAARDRDRWQSAKAIVEGAGGVTFSVIQAILVDLIKKRIGLS